VREQPSPPVAVTLACRGALVSCLQGTYSYGGNAGQSVGTWTGGYITMTFGPGNGAGYGCTWTARSSLCPVGYYCPYAGLATICNAGYYCPQGSSGPSQCGAGYFSAFAGSSSCSQCSAGTYSSAGSSGCTQCGAGSYSTAGSSGCSTCGELGAHALCAIDRILPCSPHYPPSLPRTLRSGWLLLRRWLDVCVCKHLPGSC
jgi:hypothetical protein